MTVIREIWVLDEEDRKYTRESLEWFVHVRHPQCLEVERESRQVLFAVRNPHRRVRAATAINNYEWSEIQSSSQRLRERLGIQQPITLHVEHALHIGFDIARRNWPDCLGRVFEDELVLARALIALNLLHFGDVRDRTDRRHLVSSDIFYSVLHFRTHADGHPLMVAEEFLFEAFLTCRNNNCIRSRKPRLSEFFQLGRIDFLQRLSV
jgi:hypothetical protein